MRSSVEIDQKTKQGCQLVSVAVGERNSEHDIFLARVTIKQSVEGGGQRHEEADAFASTEAADSFRGIPPKREDLLFTLVGERSRSRLFRRQIKRIGAPFRYSFQKAASFANSFCATFCCCQAA